MRNLLVKQSQGCYDWTNFSCHMNKETCKFHWLKNKLNIEMHFFFLQSQNIFTKLLQISFWQILHIKCVGANTTLANYTRLWIDSRMVQRFNALITWKGCKETTFLFIVETVGRDVKVSNLVIKKHLFMIIVETVSVRGSTECHSAGVTSMVRP